MDGMGGLIELVLVFAFVLGFAVLELMSLRRYKKRKATNDLGTGIVSDGAPGTSAESRKTTPDV